MTDDLRDCPGCGSEREFAQRHPEPERLPGQRGRLVP